MNTDPFISLLTSQYDTHRDPHTGGLDCRAVQRAFTLIEILMVVVILAILAAIVIPKFTSAFDDSREKSIQMNLYRIRSQLGLYQQQHNGFPTLANFVNQMTQASDIDGNTAAAGTAGFPLGPYLRRIPPNANTGTKAISAGAVGTSDWFYDEATGAFQANDSATTRAY